MKIAVYAIALNEEKHISRWIESCLNADKIIVLDTGSTDKTLKLLDIYSKSYPDKIEVYKLNTQKFRFDTARNHALNAVPDDIDICVSLDLDEVVPVNFFKELANAWKPTTTRAWVKWDTGNVWWNSNRIHSRHGYQWKYPCHEIIVPTIDEEYIRLDITVKHLPDDSKPRTSYLKLLRDGYRESPDDSRMYTYFMRELMYYSMWDEITVEGKRIEDVQGFWNVEKGQTYRIIGDAYYNYKDFSKAEYHYIKATEVAPKELESWLSLAFFYYHTKQWAKCAGAADKVNYLKPGDHYIAKKASVWNMYDLLSFSYWNMGILSEAYKYAKLAVASNKFDARLKNNLKFFKEELEK